VFLNRCKVNSPCHREHWLWVCQVEPLIRNRSKSTPWKESQSGALTWTCDFCAAQLVKRWTPMRSNRNTGILLKAVPRTSSPEKKKAVLRSRRTPSSSNIIKVIKTDFYLAFAYYYLWGEPSNHVKRTQSDWLVWLHRQRFLFHFPSLYVLWLPNVQSERREYLDSRVVSSKTSWVP